MSWTNKDYLGPAAFQAAYRFIVDSRDAAAKERLALVVHENGIWRCHTVFNCVEACPKDCNQTDAIQHLKRMAVARQLRSLAFGPAKRR
jgi:succinate dehydrogenase / fumarate reductase iron-sulfur subunit